MARGIHLKQLTRENLEVLGLPGDPSGCASVQIETGEVSRGESLTPSAQRAEQGQEAATCPQRRHAGPPSNPLSPIAQGEETEPDPDWQPPDLRALARDLCRDLEITLRLLGGPAAPDSDPE